MPVHPGRVPEFEFRKYQNDGTTTPGHAPGLPTPPWNVVGGLMLPCAMSSGTCGTELLDVPKGKRAPGPEKFAPASPVQNLNKEEEQHGGFSTQPAQEAEAEGGGRRVRGRGAFVFVDEAGSPSCAPPSSSPNAADADADAAGACRFGLTVSSFRTLVQHETLTLRQHAYREHYPTHSTMASTLPPSEDI